MTHTSQFSLYLCVCVCVFQDKQSFPSMKKVRILCFVFLLLASILLLGKKCGPHCQMKNQTMDNFSKGLDTDPVLKQVQPSVFLTLNFKTFEIQLVNLQVLSQEQCSPLLELSMTIIILRNGEKVNFFYLHLQFVRQNENNL